MRKKLHLIPGTMCNEKLWRELVPYLHGYDIVYLDIPKGKNFTQLANYYNELLSSEKVCLIGFSLGGYIATYFSKMYPERVEKLFVISNSPTSLPSTELNQREEILKFVKKHGYQGMSRSRVVNLFDKENHQEHLIDLVMNMDKELGIDEFISQYQFTSARTDLAKAIRQFSFPVHFYYSDGDGLVNINWFNELRSSNPKLSLFNTSGSGHMLPLEKPEELAKYLTLWAEL
ncbi:alpha/beta hydrolase [Thalassotalea nanhaiensis]|uniref:Alpha/beta hydrolase n=1 Tax=Thalassotalea nanhaiensis TaxID=3065648 RepID=A0ABY9TIK1_9GAMM|nr:alpha/beta hydrolase [Colwelliaceae bacterium SQ345]